MILSEEEKRNTPIAPSCPKCKTELSIGGLGTSSDRKSKLPNQHLFHVLLYCRNEDCKGGFYGHFNTSISVPTDGVITNTNHRSGQ